MAGRSVNHHCPVSGKNRYAGPTEARKAAIQVAENNRKNKEAKPEMCFYYCSHCIGWHVANVVPKFARAK